MRVEDLAAFVDAEPFRPFRDVLRGGRSREVLNQDMIHLRRDPGALFFADLSEDSVRTCEVIPVAQIERIEYLGAGPVT